MKRIELEFIIEELLSEFRLEKELEKKIDEFGILSDEIDRVKHRLDELLMEYRGIESILRPMLEELTQMKVSSIRTNYYLISIKRKGYERINYSYKDGFELALTKVNKSTKKLLEEILHSTKSITNVVSTIGVQRLGEGGILTSLFNRLKGLVGRVVPKLKKGNRELDTFHRIVEKVFFV